MPEILDRESFIKKCEETYTLFETADVGNLLNEELERSRNALLFVTALVLFFIMFDVTTIEFSGITATMNAATRIVMIVLGLVVVSSLCIYYVTNANADLIAKTAKFQLLEFNLSSFKSYLSEVRTELYDDRGNREGSNTYIDELKKSEATQSKLLADYNNKIESHRKYLRWLPPIISISCFLSVVISIYCDFYYY